MSALKSAADIFREKVIGSSWIAGVIGISKFITAWEIWAICAGLIEPKPETDRQRVGKAYQQATVQLFAEDVGVPVEWNDKPYYPHGWKRVSVDAFSPSIAAADSLVEAKWVALDQAGEWGKTFGELGGPSGVPEHYLAQVQYQLSAYGFAHGYVAVNIAGNDLRYYRVPADPVIQEFLDREAEKFWRVNLMGGKEPPHEYSDEFRLYLHKRYPKEKENVRPATDDEIKLLSEYGDVCRQLRPLEKRKTKIEIDLKAGLRDAEGLESVYGKFTWKKSRDTHGVDWEALAEDQLKGYSAEEREALLASHTRLLEAGSRRIHFTDYARKEAA